MARGAVSSQPAKATALSRKVQAHSNKLWKKACAKGKGKKK